MRFITEFKIIPPASEARLQAYKTTGEVKLCQLISQSFGWENKGHVRPDDIALKYAIEIEAFPMDKWVEFRRRFLAALPDYDNTSRIRLENALHDLESFGKPETTQL